MELLSSLRESTVPRASCKTGNDTCRVGLSLLSGRASNAGGVGSANTVAGGNGAAGSDGAGGESEPANDKGGGTASASGCAAESSSRVPAAPSSCSLASTALSPAEPPTSAGAPVVRPSRQAANCSVCTAPGKPFCGTLLSASTLISESTASSLPSNMLSSSILRTRLFAPSICSDFSSEAMESPRRKAVEAASAATAPTKCSAAGGSARCGAGAAGASSAASAAWPTLGSVSSEDSAAGRRPSPPPLPQASPAEVFASPCTSCRTSESGSCFSLCASSSGTSDGMVAHDTGNPTAGVVSW
mmetsp:Transcript_47153/g.135081  ORF Transcript_47153/g.135081 Transcript_47153/m.135081 type:complete len:301 (-) Transcript_47153:1421-2323(-)